MTNWSHWAHVMWSTRGHWLPGDPRGFRDHDHRIHSSGDYKDPPPHAEHAGLRRHAQSIAASRVVLTREQRVIAGEVIVRKLLDDSIAIRALAVGAKHVHVLTRVGPGNARKPIGIAKQRASRALMSELPGRVWGQRCHVVRIRDQPHYRSVVGYILKHIREGAWVWEPQRFRAR